MVDFTIKTKYTHTIIHEVFDKEILIGRIKRDVLFDGQWVARGLDGKYVDRDDDLQVLYSRLKVERFD